MRNDILFWNVDTQYDFVMPEGKLYVQGAEKLNHTWKKITELAKEEEIRVVNTADWHLPDSPELSDSPDFIHTFPPHCMAGSSGAQYVEETRPDDPVIVKWERKYSIERELMPVMENRNFVLLKDRFDVFSGNPNALTVLDLIAPDTVIVYGVTTNVCVDFAVKGLVEKVKNVLVVEDAIKELPNIDLPFDSWKKKGVRFVKSGELEKMV